MLVDYQWKLHLQLQCFYIKFAIVNEFQQYSNTFPIVKKSSIYHTLFITQKCWEITHCKLIVNQLYPITFPSHFQTLENIYHTLCRDSVVL